MPDSAPAAVPTAVVDTPSTPAPAPAPPPTASRAAPVRVAKATPPVLKLDTTTPRAAGAKPPPAPAAASGSRIRGADRRLRVRGECHKLRERASALGYHRDCDPAAPGCAELYLVRVQGLTSADDGAAGIGLSGAHARREVRRRTARSIGATCLASWFPRNRKSGAADQSHRRRKVRADAVLAVVFVARRSGRGAQGVSRARAEAERDTVFVSAPAWPKADPRPRRPSRCRRSRSACFSWGRLPTRRMRRHSRARLAGRGLPGECRRAGQRHRLAQQGDRERAWSIRRRPGGWPTRSARALGRPITIIEPTGIRAK